MSLSEVAMEYSMMPPPQSTSCSTGVPVGSASGDFSGAGGGAGRFSTDSPQSQLFNSEQSQEPAQNGQYTAGQYKVSYLGEFNQLFIDRVMIG